VPDISSAFALPSVTALSNLPVASPPAAAVKVAAAIALDTLNMSNKAQKPVDPKAPCVAPKATLWSTIMDHKGLIVGTACVAALLAGPSLLGAALASGSAMALAGSGALVIGPSLALCAMFLSGAFASDSHTP
jgi:hypothetical protein